MTRAAGAFSGASSIPCSTSQAGRRCPTPPTTSAGRRCAPTTTQQLPRNHELCRELGRRAARRRHHRRRVLGPLHAPPPAQPRPALPRLRDRRRRGGHVVLEPLPGCALRLRELLLLLLVLRRDPAGVELDRALSLPGGDP